MLKSLYGKIVIVLLVMFVCIGLLDVVQTLYTTKLYLHEVNQRLHRSLSEYLAADSEYIKEGQPDIQALKDTFEKLMHINPSIELYLLDPHGEILAYSAPEGRVKRTHINLKPVEEFLKTDANLPILGDDPRDPERKKVFSVAPIPSQGPIEGYLYIILGGEEYDSITQRLETSYILRLSTWIALVGLLFIFVLGLFLFNLITRRLRGLSATLDIYKQSDFQQPITLPGNWKKTSGDEIDRLGHIASQMSDRISDHLSTIKRVDTYRREMVSMVSHDLRNPLTSLQGYLETLLIKENEITPEKRRSYIETSLKQSHRLGNLVSELFELAKLDSPDVKINPEPFNLGDLVQDILQKYSLTVDKKNVKIGATLPDALPMVYGDIALIERAIQNLIDNALSFSRPQGTIDLIIELGENRLTLNIKDDGYGIKKEDIPFIFDRFYQGQSEHRDEDDDSTGLGLAITKRILELHNSLIKVQSEPDKGAVFSFDLGLYQT